MDVKIRTALVSVSDKTGIVEFAGSLNKMGVKIISTGGTARKIIQTLKSKKVEVVAMVCIIDKGNGLENLKSEENINISCLKKAAP